MGQALARDRQDIMAIQWASLASTLMGRIHLDEKRNQQARPLLEEARRLLEPAVAANRQNNQLAVDLQWLHDSLETVYVRLGRKDLALKEAQARVDLAASHRGTPQDSHWRDIQLQALGYLADRFEALERTEDQLATRQQQVAIHRETVTDAGKPYPIDLLEALRMVAQTALKARDGLRAYEAHRQIIDHAERHLATARPGGWQEGSKYTDYDTLQYNAVIELSQVTPRELGSLSNARRIEILAEIADKVGRAARADPRVIPYQLVVGRALHNLATAHDLAGDVVSARETHERASIAGNNNSTIILRRWYDEGYKSIKPDKRLFDALATRELPATLNIDVQRRSDGKAEVVSLWFREPRAGEDMMADEVYRILRYMDRELTDRGRKVIGDVYDLARQNKTTVSRLLAMRTRKTSNRAAAPPTRLTSSPSRLSPTTSRLP